jgi:hypothetical protein
MARRVVERQFKIIAGGMQKSLTPEKKTAFTGW